MLSFAKFLKIHFLKFLTLKFRNKLANFVSFVGNYLGGCRIKTVRKILCVA